MCRYCHDENEQHYFNRKTVTELICTECDTRQKVQAECEKCGVRFGKVKPWFYLTNVYIIEVYIYQWSLLSDSFPQYSFNTDFSTNMHLWPYFLSTRLDLYIFLCLFIIWQWSFDIFKNNPLHISNGNIPIDLKSEDNLITHIYHKEKVYYSDRASLLTI